MIEEDVQYAIENHIVDYQSQKAFMVPSELCKIKIQTRQSASTELKPKIKSWCDNHIKVEYDHVAVQQPCVESICHGGYDIWITNNAGIELLILRFASMADWIAFRLRWL